MRSIRVFVIPSICISIHPSVRHYVYFLTLKITLKFTKIEKIRQILFPSSSQLLSLLLDATTHLYERSCPSVRSSVRPSVRPSDRPSVRPSVPCYFRKTKIVDFEDRKSLNDVINNATMSDDEVVTSYGPPRSLFSQL